MLLGFGGKNCWCFKDWMQVDLSLGDGVPSDVSMGLQACTAMCFKGANASGKTNGLKVLAFISDFAKNSFLYKPDAPVLFDSFFYNNNPSEFYVEYISNKNFYRYELITTKKAIQQESLFRKKDEQGSREVEIFRRVKNNVIKNSLYKGHGDIVFRDNASFISTLHQYALEEIIDIYNFFFYMSLNVTYTGLYDRISMNPNILAEYYAKNVKPLEFAEKKIHQFDTGINKIVIQKREDEQNKEIYFPVFLHVIEQDKVHPLLYEAESSGTKALFNNLEFYSVALQTGGVLILDEFDINLHPDILPHLLDLFIKAENNPKHAQIIFTTHNNDIMDILGRYRTYLFEKEDGESFCYRLDEPKSSSLRNDRPLSVPYKKHLIGGFPKIGS